MRRGSSLSPSAAGGLAGLASGVLILGPALAPGFLLFYDMVFVPEPNWGLRTLGLDGSVPRAVPNDLVVAALSELLPGWMVQKLLLLLIFMLAGAGVGALFGSRSGALAAALCACWNPYVAERLAIGHWAFLLGYAMVPWVARAAAGAVQGRPRSTIGMALWLVLTAAAGSTASFLVTLTAGAVLLAGGPSSRGADGWRRRGTGLGVLLLVELCVNAAWWLPSLLLPGGVPADPAGVPAFAATADTPWGLWGSLLTGGGIWNSAAWPVSRGSALLTAVALVGVGASVVQLLRSRGRLHAAVPGLFVAGVVGVLLAAASAVDVGAPVVTWFVVNVPGGGIIRDSQKLLAPWMLTVAVGAGLVTEGVRRWAGAEHSPSDDRSRDGRPYRPRERVIAPLAVTATLAATIWPVVALPSLAWGELGTWRTASYPHEFLVVAERLDRAPPATVASFPWTLYRRYEWNHDFVVLDPWQRLVSQRVLVNDNLPLSRATVGGEDPAAARITAAVEKGEGSRVVAALRDEGVRFVVLDRTQPGSPQADGFFEGLPARWSHPRLAVYDLGPGRGPSTTLPPVAAAGLALSGLTGTVVVTLWLWLWLWLGLRVRWRLQAAGKVEERPEVRR